MEKQSSARNIIISKIQIAPYNPDEWHELCLAQITIDCVNKTATFEHLSGGVPILDVVIDVLAANKHWLKIADESDAEIEACSYFLMAGPHFYIAHFEDGIFPVFDKRLTDEPEISITKATFTPLEFYLIAQNWCLPKSRSSWNMKKHLRYLQKNMCFKYIR